MQGGVTWGLLYTFSKEGTFPWWCSDSYGLVDIPNLSQAGKPAREILDGTNVFVCLFVCLSAISFEASEARCGTVAAGVFLNLFFFLRRTAEFRGNEHSFI